ncbi:hypothetical protein [Nitrospira sp. M1]
MMKTTPMFDAHAVAYSHGSQLTGPYLKSDVPDVNDYGHSH